MRRLARLQVALGLLWVLDALLQLEPSELRSGLPGSITDGAMGQPAALQSLLAGAGRLAARDPEALGLAIAAVQLVLGAAILHPRSRRAGLLASVPWALAIWVVGEGLGGIATGFASLTEGAPGAALVYALAAIVLLPPRPDRTGAGRPGRGPAPWPERAVPAAALGALGATGATWCWAGLWAGAAVLQAVPVVTLGFKLSAGFQMASLGEPAPVAALDHLLGRLAAGNGPATTAALLAVEVASGAAAFARGAWRRRLLSLAVAACAILWVAGENLGGLLSGTASDVGAMPLYVLLARSLAEPREQRSGSLWHGRAVSSPIPAEASRLAPGRPAAAAPGGRPSPAVG